MRPCKICDLPGSGNHFGAFSCRACAAFFRRGAVRKIPYECKNNSENGKSCIIFNEFSQQFNCKKCRMDKCLEMGMKVENFQFGRDLIGASCYSKPQFLRLEKRALCKNFVELIFLLNEGERILLTENPKKASECLTTLQKLSYGLESVRPLPNPETYQFLIKYGVNEKLKDWEDSFLVVARWLTYFDRFQQLPISLRIKILNGIWHTCVLFDKMALNFHAKKSGFANENILIAGYSTYFDMAKVKMDMAGLSKTDEETAERFIRAIDWDMRNFIGPLLALNPDNVEMVFMMAKFSFHYAGKRFQGQILEITEKFLDILANDLHHYYEVQNSTSRYATRLAQLLKFVRQLENDFLEKQKKVEVGDVFDIWKVEFSHPEVFKDNLC